MIIHFLGELFWLLVGIVLVWGIPAMMWDYFQQWREKRRAYKEWRAARAVHDAEE